jgi:hypothetical protein
LKVSVSDGTITKESLKDIWNGKCAICGCYIEWGNKLTHLDHITPLSKQGTHSITNVQWTCAECNHKKSDKIILLNKDEINLDNISDTQCYKLAGNGQSLNVVTKIFKEMFKDEDFTYKGLGIIEKKGVMFVK